MPVPLTRKDAMPESLVTVLRDAARLHRDRPAVRWSGGEVTYGALWAGVERLAAALRAEGAGEGRTGVLLPNLPTFPLTVYGVLAAGGRVALLNPLSSAREVAENLETAGATRVLTVEPLLPLLPPGATALLVDALPGALRVVAPGADPREVPLGEAGPVATPCPEDEAAVLFTAANDGWLRGAPLTHASLVANLRSTQEAKRLVPDDVVAAALPLIHAFGFTVGMNAALASGACVVPVERFHAGRMLDLLEEAGITVLAGVPAMFIGMIGAAERRGVPAHRLRVALCGGAPLRLEVARRWEELFGLPLRQGYGLTEASPVCLFNRVDRPNRPGTLGYPFPGVEVAILGPDGAPLPAGEVGEICVRGENVFGGYLGDGGRRPADFHGEWLRTGDLGSVEEEGVVRFRGVLKPMFTRNGFNVYPREIERVLRADPRIADARVRALPDPVRENEVVVYVDPAPGAALTEEEVRALCKAGLAAYKQPARIEIGG